VARTLEAKDVDSMTPEDSDPHFTLVTEIKQEYQLLLWSFIWHDWGVAYDIMTD